MFYVNTICLFSDIYMLFMVNLRYKKCVYEKNTSSGLEGVDVRVSTYVFYRL